jgi:hypothetical protein
MTRVLIVLTCFLAVAGVAAQQNKSNDGNGTSGGPNPSAKVLEAKIRKAWEDYKNRNKKDFSAILASDFGEVTNDGDGILSKDTELSEMDHFDLVHYELKDFKVRPIGADAALVTYTAEYDGKYDNTPMKMKTIYGEVWQRFGKDWKLRWVQETKLKD